MALEMAIDYESRAELAARGSKLWPQYFRADFQETAIPG